MGYGYVLRRDWDGTLEGLGGSLWERVGHSRDNMVVVVRRVLEMLIVMKMHCYVSRKVKVLA